MWRHAASATTDSNLAEEVALRGDSGVGIIFKVRRSLGARPVAEFSEYPEQGEVVFPPGSVFRVVGHFPCNERTIRRGMGDSAALAAMSVDIGASSQRNDALSWEEAKSSRNIVIMLDEEEPGSIQTEEMP